MSELTEQNLTRQQAEQEMACLRKIYASVRLLDPKMLAEEPCYPPWKNAVSYTHLTLPTILQV